MKSLHTTHLRKYASERHTQRERERRTRTLVFEIAAKKAFIYTCPGGALSRAGFFLDDFPIRRNLTRNASNGLLTRRLASIIDDEDFCLLNQSDAISFWSKMLSNKEIQ